MKAVLEAPKMEQNYTGIYPEKTIIQTDTCVLIFIAAVSTIAKTVEAT